MGWGFDNLVFSLELLAILRYCGSLNISIYVRWDNHKGAENICKQLGYAGGTRYTTGGGTGPINAGNRLCSGGEKTVFDCPLQGGRTDTTRCTHNHDQGVHCTDEGEKNTYKQAQ